MKAVDLVAGRDYRVRVVTRAGDTSRHDEYEDPREVVSRRTVKATFVRRTGNWRARFREYSENGGHRRSVIDVPYSCIIGPWIEDPPETKEHREAVEVLCDALLERAALDPKQVRVNHPVFRPGPELSLMRLTPEQATLLLRMVQPMGGCGG